MTFALIESENSSIYLSEIVISTFVLVGWFALAGGVYESSLNNFLEIPFLCNLGITSAAVLLDANVVVCISTSVAFIAFVCIVRGHATKQLLRIKCGLKVKEKLPSHLSLIKQICGAGINKEYSTTS